MIFGLTGKTGCGKDTIADMMENYGFVHFSLSDEIRRKLKEANRAESRENEIAMGNELRKKHGPGILARLALESIGKKKGHSVVTSIRNPKEVEELRKKKNFKLVSIEMSSRTRYYYLKKRNRKGDVRSFQHFEALEKKEAQGAVHEQQLDKVITMADINLQNNKDFAHLRFKVRKLLEHHGIKTTSLKPSWDQYFMGVSELIGRRSSCIRRQIGAVLVRDKMILSTGYNGTAKGTRNCDEGGCDRCNVVGLSSVKLGDCICVHAEENALLQAAFNGVSTRGSTLYLRYEPCSYCAKHIINAGVKRVFYREEYGLEDKHKEMTLSLFKQAGIKSEKLDYKPFGLDKS